MSWGNTEGVQFWCPKGVPTVPLLRLIAQWDFGPQEGGVRPIGLQDRRVFESAEYCLFSVGIIENIVQMQIPVHHVIPVQDLYSITDTPKELSTRVFGIGLRSDHVVWEFSLVMVHGFPKLHKPMVFRRHDATRIPVDGSQGLDGGQDFARHPELARRLFVLLLLFVARGYPFRGGIVRGR